VSSIRGSAADLPTVWSATTTTPADRRRIARMLSEKVVVTVDKTSDQSDYPRPVARLRELSTGCLNAAEVAERLNAEGFHPPKRTRRFTPDMVPRRIGQPGWSRREPHGSRVGLGRDEYRPGGLASRLGISRDTVRRWVKVKWVHVRRDANGHAVIGADAEELKRSRALRRLPRTGANKARLAKRKRPKPRPAR